MAYRFKRNDASVESAVRRIAGEQIEGAIASIDAGDTAAVHDVRKCCKKLRGLLRLIRPAFPDYAEENAAFRATAAMISHARDAKVMEDTFDALVERYADRIDAPALASLRERFARDRVIADDNGLAEALGGAREQLVAARERADRWALSEAGWKALRGGLEKTYARARKDAREARANPGGETLHELRKRIKYHWYQSRLLENLWPEMMAARRDLARDLSEMLGDHHDLTVFEERLSADPEAFGDPRTVEVVIGLAHARRAALEEEAWPMVDRLLAQSPGALVEQLAVLWRVWRAEDVKEQTGAEPVSV